MAKPGLLQCFNAPDLLQCLNAEKFPMQRGHMVFLRSLGDFDYDDPREVLNWSNAELQQIKKKYASTQNFENLDRGMRALRVIDFVQCQYTQKNSTYCWVYVICQLISEEDLKQERVLKPGPIEMLTKNDENGLRELNRKTAKKHILPWNPTKTLLQDRAPYISGKDNMELLAINEVFLTTLQESPLQCTMEQYLEKSRANRYAINMQVNRRFHLRDQLLFCRVLNEKERQDYYRQDEVHRMEVEPPVDESILVLFREHEDGGVEVRVCNSYDALPILPNS